MARPFTRGELEELAKPLRNKRPFNDLALATLHSASGGNPALATYGFECLWPIDGDAVEQLRLIFGTFLTERATFVRAVKDAVSRNGLVRAPGRVLEVVRASRGPISRAELLGACADDRFVLDLHQAVELLQGAGLVDLRGPVSSDPVDIMAVASILNLGTKSASAPDPIMRLLDDLATTLGEFFRLSSDFRDGQGVVHEKVFSAVLAIGLRARGWSCTREPAQAAGEVDLRVSVPERGEGAHVVVETKIWPRNDYRDIQGQVDAYRIAQTQHGVAVMVVTGSESDWPTRYEAECLQGRSYERLESPPDLVGRWRVRGGRGEPTDHFLVRVARRG